MHMPETNRGFILPYVILVCVVVLAFFGLLLANAQNLATGMQSIDSKNGTFDAAEAGLNAALEALNISQSSHGLVKGSLANGYAYEYTIYTNFLGLSPKPIADPITGKGLLTVPAQSALVVSIGSDPNGGRPSTVEALVAAHSVKVDYWKYAIIAGRNIQGSYQNGIIDVGKRQNAFVHANGSIDAVVSGTIEGVSTASGDTNTLAPRRVGTVQQSLPTVGQFDMLVSDYEDEVMLYPGPADVYQGGGTKLASTYTCPPPQPSDGCLLFYDGTLDLAAAPLKFVGPWTFVVNGDFTDGAPADVTFADAPGLIVANGNATIEGDGLNNAYVEVKGSTLFGGSGTFTGAIITLGNFTFDSGNSSGPFQFDSNVVPPSKTIMGRVKVVSYAEY
jgi:Tfp pilus assembly protein PilX